MARKLEVGCSIGWAGDDRTDYIDLPDNWDEMSEIDRQNWSDDMLDTHVSNYLNSWTKIVDSEE